MSLPIDKTARPLSAWALAALLGASSCSASDQRLATITLDANVPEVTPPCVPQIREAYDVGLDLYFVIDHSFVWDIPDWYLLALDGLKVLFGQLEFRDLGVGFAIYPAFEPPPTGCIEACGPAPTCDCLDDCGCHRSDYEPRLGLCSCVEWETSCDEADYVPRFEIEPLTLEGRQQQALVDIREPPAGPPTLNLALLGSLRYRNAWENEQPRRRITQVLIAAADFTICPSRISESVRVLGGSDKPKTYVVTVDESESDYDDLAIAGRTDAALRLSTSTRQPAIPLPQALVNLVRRIRAADGRCEYLLPTGMPDLDANKVNFSATRDGASLPYVGNVSGCALAPQGWYYDDVDHPTRILTCESTCKTLHAASNPTPSSAFIQLGCPTMGNASR